MRKKTLSAKSTGLFAASLAEKVKRGPAARKARVIALTGELGAGKTTFTKAFARALGVRKVTSPTFILIRHSRLRSGKFSDFYHIDAYRLKSSTEIMRLGFGEMLADPGAIILIEWADKIKRALPKNTMWIRFEHGSNPHERIVTSMNIRTATKIRRAP